MFRPALVIFLCMLVAACGMTPSHDIKPRPDHIRAGVQEGDKLEIITKDGEEIELIVSEVTADAIVSDQGVIKFGDIEKITKRSWTEPGHPCGAGLPVGCSVPEVVLLLDEYGRQVDKFRSACVAHDFCYRHGYATYGIEREKCDTEFLEAMRAECKSLGILSVIDVKELAICELAASQTYEAVRQHGEPAYRRSTSTYCEYL